MAKHDFFKKLDSMALRVTYASVTLRSDYSETAPEDAEVSSWFSKNVPLKIPIVSAAMDTVTTSEMAIAMAKNGGIGVIHRSMNQQNQAIEVSKVKTYLNCLISRPKFVNKKDSIEAIHNRREKEGMHYHSFPVLDDNGKIVGILTSHDFSMCSDINLRAEDIMTTEICTAPLGTTVSEAYEIMRSNKKKTLPIVNKHGGVDGMYVFSDVERVVSRIKSGNGDIMNVDNKGHLRVAGAIGTGRDELERASILIQSGVDVIVIDTAHADTKSVIEDTLKPFKANYPEIDIVVGNVSEAHSALRLAKAGADGIKVGQGCGSICTTRIVAGIGCPQLTAVYNCAEAIRDYNIPLCADGGIEYSGDIPKAVGAGASSVMLGNLIAGSDESPGETQIIKGIRYKIYRGMGSVGAMSDSQEARERYREKETVKDKLVPEGVEGMVPHKGPVSEILRQHVVGLRRGMGYVGAANIKSMQEKADFGYNDASGQKESHPHDIEYMKNAPNYHQ